MTGFLPLFITSRQRPYSIRTRIKTLVISLNSAAPSQVRDHIPLEQGLRPDVLISVESNISSQRPYSIRTRIKTVALSSHLSLRFCQRPYSIRTRIKTVHCDGGQQRRLDVRDHIPLEQGLRHIEVIHLHDCLPVRDHIPLEQGLRHSSSAISTSAEVVSETIFH